MDTFFRNTPSHINFLKVSKMDVEQTKLFYESLESKPAPKKKQKLTRHKEIATVLRFIEEYQELSTLLIEDLAKTSNNTRLDFNGSLIDYQASAIETKEPSIPPFYLGYLGGILYMLSPNNAKGFQTVLASICGQISVERKRWTPRKKILDALVSKAEESWKAGSLLLHNKMADELLKNDQEAAKIISKPVLLAALKPIAAKFGKVRGMKGNFQENLPKR